MGTCGSGIGKLGVPGQKLVSMIWFRIGEEGRLEENW
jgi:hypothetical protein